MKTEAKRDVERPRPLSRCGMREWVRKSHKLLELLQP